jgi:KDO2-lipid IV(A) lauroyltransferase
MPRAVAWCIVQIYRAYYATLRVRCLLPDGRMIRARDHPLQGQILALSERDTLALCGLLLHHRSTTLVAHGRDGDWATRLLAIAGCRVVRGSTRRGGMRAMLALHRTANTSDDPVAIVVDGPLGPAGVAKPGALWYGIRTGRPVRAIGVAARWKVTLPRTWSGIYIPLPFSTLVATYVTEPPISGEAARDALAGELTRQLASARERARAALGAGWTERAVSRVGQFAHAAAVLVRDAVLTALALPFLVPVWLLPWTAALRLGRWYGYVAWAVMPEARRVGMINLRRALGLTFTSSEARRAVREVFGSLGQSIAEGIQFARRYKHSPALARSLYECEDPELERRILQDPRPRIFVTGHLGSWELAAGIAATQTERPAAVVVRQVDNRFLNALWRRLRIRHDREWIEKRGAASELLARLRRGEDVAMLVDEHGGYRGVFVPFFGTLASTRKTPAVLSIVTGAPVIAGACVRRPGQPFLFRLAMFEPNRELPVDEAIRDLTARLVATYEEWIRDAPLQWRWIHWRWKARLDGSEERYGRKELREAFNAARDPSLLIR